MGREGKRKRDDPAKSNTVLALAIDWCSLVAVFWLGVWFWMFHWPFWVIMTAMLLAPPLALAALIPARALVDFGEHQPFLPGLTILAPLLLLYGTLGRFNFLDGRSCDWALLIPVAALAAAIYIFRKSLSESEDLPWKTLPWVRVWLAAAAGFVALVYADGAIKLVDVGLDTAAPATYRATVTAKDLVYPIWSKYRSKNLADTYLNLSPWGPDQVTDQIDVDGPQLYDAVDVGSTVCVHLHGGYLGLRWYEIGRC
jgi:hypothetical protein